MIITREQIIGNNRLPKDNKISLFESLLASTNRTGMDLIIKYLRDTDFYTAPASAKYHSDYEGGLLDHSLMVYSVALGIYNEMKNIDPNIGVSVTEENIIISALLHDICKVCFYVNAPKWKKYPHGDWVQVNGYEINDSFPIGHGEKSVMMLLKLGLDINPCEMLAIRYHMGLFGEDNIAFKTSMKSAIKMCPLVSIIQTADWLSSMLLEDEL